MEFKPGEDPRSARWDPLLEILITVALGLAAILTATAVYLNERSDHDATVKFTETIERVNEAAAASTQATQLHAEDSTLFSVYSSTFYGQGEKAAVYLRDNAMSPRLQKMLVWWSETKGSGPTPFTDENPFYTTPEADRAASLTEEADGKLNEAKDKQDKASDYVLVEVILATSLFLYGIAGVTRRFTIRIGTFAAGTLIFLVACVLLVTV